MLNKLYRLEVLALKVSVIMPVYNREKYIKEAIESVLNQTFQDFELIIIDDGSTDNTVNIIKEFTDKRIKLIQHETNKGVAAARNTGYLAAQGEYIVISDSDDINHPDKFLEQVNVLDKNFDIDIVGCFYQHFFEEKELEILQYPEDDELIKIYSIFWLKQAPASMFRKEKIKNEGIFLHDESYKAAVDTEWFHKQPLNINFMNIQKVLYYYRRHENQMTLDSPFSLQKQFIGKSRAKVLETKLGIPMTEEREQTHNLLCDPFLGDFNLEKMNKWVELLVDTNKRKQVFNDEKFTKVVLSFYKDVCQWYDADPKSLTKYVDLLYKCDLAHIYQFKESDEDLRIKFAGKKIAILGTLYLGRKTVYKLKEQLGLNVQFYIDNYRYTRIQNIDQLTLYPSSIIDEQQVDVVLVTIESNARWQVSHELKSKYPKLDVFTIDDFLTKL